MLVKLTVRTRFQSAKSRRCAGDSWAIPTTFASTSTGCPNSCCAAAIAALTSASTLTSVRRKTHCAPDARISSAVEFPACVSISAATTLAPCCAKSEAMAFPIPIAAPVTSAMRPCRRTKSPFDKAEGSETITEWNVCSTNNPDECGADNELRRDDVSHEPSQGFMCDGLTQQGTEYIQVSSSQRRKARSRCLRSEERRVGKECRGRCGPW